MAITNTNTPKRITKAMRFDDIKALLTGNPVTYGTTVDEAAAFCDSEKALLMKKNASDKKPTKTQEENEGYKALILDFLSLQSDAVTCTDIQKGIPEFADFNNQKVAQLMRQLLEANKVTKEIKKGRSLFSIT